MYDRYDSSGTYIDSVARPARLSVPGGVAIPPTEAQLNAAGYYRAVQETPPAPGYIGRGTRTRRIEGALSVNGWSEWVGPLQAEMERRARLVQEYGELIGNLAHFLEIFGVRMPVERRDVPALVLAAAKLRPELTADAVMLMAIWSDIAAAGLSDKDVYEVALVIGVADAEPVLDGERRG